MDRFSGMRHRFCLMASLVLLLVAVVSPWSAAAAEPGAKPDKSALGVTTFSFSVVVMVLHDPLRTGSSAAIAHPDAADDHYGALETLASDMDESGNFIEFRRLADFQAGNTLGILRIHSGGMGGGGAMNVNLTPAEAKKALAAVEKRLEAALRGIYETNVAAMQSRHNVLIDRLETLRTRIRNKKAEFKKFKETLGLYNPEAQSEQLTAAMQNRLKLRLNEEELKARREAILKVIVEVTAKTKAAGAEQQKELDELAHIVELRLKRLEKAKTLAGSHAVSQDEVAQAELELSRARADLAERRRIIAQQASSEQLSRLNQQLADVQIELEVARSRSSANEQVIRDLAVVAGGPPLEYELLAREVANLDWQEKVLSEEYAELHRKTDSYVTFPPKVVELSQGSQAK